MLLSLALTASLLASDDPRWEAQEIDPHVGNVCYAVTTADVNGDGKLDVVAVTEDAVVWFENPSWTKKDIIRGKTARDNVCISAHDIDGDSRVDFALGAGWKPPDTNTPGTLQWIGRDASGEWQVHPIKFDEPSIHRIRWADVLGTGSKQLVVVPLQGRGTKGPNWGEGPGVKVVVCSIPADPASPDWTSEVASDSLHTIHGFDVDVPSRAGAPAVLHVAAWEGVFRLERTPDGAWKQIKLGDGDQVGRRPNKGASEIKLGRYGARGHQALATIEPWHGDQIIVYLPRAEKPEWSRYHVDSGVNWGHAVWFADLDGLPGQELIIGQRDPRTDDRQPKGPGIRVFYFDRILIDGAFMTLPHQQAVDDGGMACEDALAADLDGDGRPEIVAGGRATHNVKIYWNRPPAAPKP